VSAWRAWVRPRRVVMAAGLVAAWCALWGELSWANVLSGLVLAVVVLSIGIGTAGTGGFRIAPLLRFAWLVAGDLVVSTISVAREVLTPTDHTREAIVAIRLPPASRRHLLLLSSAVTVTPGTAVVDVDADTATLYVHILHAGRRHAVEAHVRELAEVACRALPDSPEEPSWS
jgi:multicomponent Na+:H+ antiporter subunit E